MWGPNALQYVHWTGFMSAMSARRLIYLYSTTKGHYISTTMFKMVGKSWKRIENHILTTNFTRMRMKLLFESFLHWSCKINKNIILFACISQFLIRVRSCYTEAMHWRLEIAWELRTITPMTMNSNGKFTSKIDKSHNSDQIYQSNHYCSITRCS